MKSPQEFYEAQQNQDGIRPKGKDMRVYEYNFKTTWNDRTV